jgi:hypothetical protein
MLDDQIDQSADKGIGTKDTVAGEGQQEGVDDKPNANETDTGSEDAGKGEEDKKGGGSSEDTKEAKAPKDTHSGEDDGLEPLQRKRLSKQDFIIRRQQKKLAKGLAKDEGEQEIDEVETDDSEIAPEDEALITKVVAKRFAPIIDKSLADDDNREVSTFLEENPDFKPFEAKARRFMQHPSRRSLPIKSIFYEVAGDALIRIGAERQRVADLRAKESQTGGGSGRSGEGARSAFDLSSDEFEAKQEEIRRSR